MRDRVLAAEPPVAELAASRLLLGEALLGELLRAEHFAEGGVCGCTRCGAATAAVLAGTHGATTGASTGSGKGCGSGIESSAGDAAFGLASRRRRTKPRHPSRRRQAHAMYLPGAVPVEVIARRTASGAAVREGAHPARIQMTSSRKTSAMTTAP